VPTAATAREPVRHGVSVPCPLEPGTRVEVRARFDQRWARGFEVDTVVTDASVPGAQYRVWRRSDGSVLPAVFVADEVREERRGRSLWWL
jgi:hypothetical protein